MAWDDFDISVHGHEEQIKRIDNSFEVVFNSIENGKAVTNHGYEVTLDSCSCPDFLTRKLPCKHIYALAKQLNRFVVSQKMERKENLIVELDGNGNSKGWAFVVRKCNFPSLDIRFNNITQSYTQGEDFHFNVGAIYYDNPIAYSGEPWGSVVNRINFSIQILSSTTNFRHYRFEHRANTLYAIPIMEYGVTSFNIYRIDHDTGKEAFYKEVSCYNKDFVDLLKYGHCKILSGGQINILELK